MNDTEITVFGTFLGVVGGAIIFVVFMLLVSCGSPLSHGKKRLRHQQYPKDAVAAGEGRLPDHGRRVISSGRQHQRTAGFQDQLRFAE